MWLRIFILFGVAVILVNDVKSQKFVPNYDESKIPEFTLPDPLVCEDGTPVTSAEQWRRQRRARTTEVVRATNLWAPGLTHVKFPMPKLAK